MPVSIDSVRRNWGWMLAFGVILLLWGIFAISDSMFFTAFSVYMIAWLLIIGGVIELIQSFRHHEHQLWWHLIEAVLAIVAGVLLFRNPAAGALVITIIMAAYFIVSGIFRIVASLSLKLPNWGWSLFSGIVTLALGILVWAGWPGTAFWVLGLYVGVSLLFIGWAEIMLALALRGGTHYHPLPA